MFAKNFERLLFYELVKSDFIHEQYTEFSARFESLRSYGRLPRGRENRAQELTPEQMADAVLGTVTAFPKWAGHAATILAKLCPVGGTETAYLGAANLQGAIAKLLVDSMARTKFVTLTVSGAESGTNSNGYAALTYRDDGNIRHQFYVSGMAVSLLSVGGDKRYNPDNMHSSVTREVTFRTSFFNRLASEIERARMFPQEPEGDGSEYDSEEERAERYRKLGVNSCSRYLHVAVENQVTWPKKETLVKFDRFHFVLMPKTAMSIQSVHVDLVANRLSDSEAITVVNRFLSVMTWCCDQYAIADPRNSGSPIPTPLSKRDLAFATTSEWILDRMIPATEDQRRALALYREGRNAEDNFMVSYAVLNYYKIVEIKYPNKGDSRKVKDWFGDKYQLLKSDRQYSSVLEDFAAMFGGKAAGDYIFDSYRVAVAHIGTESKIDPDQSQDLRRLHKAADVLKIFARWFIKNELGVSDCLWSGT